MAFMFLEDALGPEPMGRGDWIFTGIWILSLRCCKLRRLGSLGNDSDHNRMSDRLP